MHLVISFESWWSVVETRNKNTLHLFLSFLSFLFFPLFFFLFFSFFFFFQRRTTTKIDTGNLPAWLDPADNFQVWFERHSVTWIPVQIWFVNYRGLMELQAGAFVCKIEILRLHQLMAVNAVRFYFRSRMDCPCPLLAFSPFKKKGEGKKKERACMARDT